MTQDIKHVAQNNRKSCTGCKKLDAPVDRSLSQLFADDPSLLGYAYFFSGHEAYNVGPSLAWARAQTEPKPGPKRALALGFP